MSHNPNIDTQQPHQSERDSIFLLKNKASINKTPTYAHDVYKRRFKHFRTLRLLSLLVGGSILLLLILGMGQLYTMVFLTIEDTEHVFLITEKRRTQTIDFKKLEEVRASWNQKYSSPTTTFTKPLFPEPILDIMHDVQ